jgi:formylglycine-generating enzyme required for sulfatase activity
MNNRYWRGRFLAEEGLFQWMEEEGGFHSAKGAERWKRWMTLDEAAFEAALNNHFPSIRLVEPASWRDARLNSPAQPVVGVCWYEARAYAAWLSAQTGGDYRLPTEVEWEAAARGTAARAHAWGDSYAVERCNSFETRLLRTSPVGVFVEGDTPEGMSDVSGSVWEWTSSLFGEIEGEDGDVPEFAYPYHPDDGREDVEAPPTAARVVRGGSWFGYSQNALASYRLSVLPSNNDLDQGFRLVLSVPTSSDALRSGAA